MVTLQYPRIPHQGRDLPDFGHVAVAWACKQGQNLTHHAEEVKMVLAPRIVTHTPRGSAVPPGNAHTEVFNNREETRFITFPEIKIQLRANFSKASRRNRWLEKAPRWMPGHWLSPSEVSYFG